MWLKFKEYFAITKSESRGLAVLLVLLFCLWGINFYLRYFTKPSISGVAFEIVHSIQSDTLLNPSNGSGTKKYVEIGFFNPNDISYEDLVRSGLSEKLSRSVVNYRSKGGKFFSIDEVYKIYFMDSAWIQFHKPFMTFESKSDKHHYTHRKSELKPFDPNNADSTELFELGFKPWQISNLLRYRSRGGKFFKKEDLKRLYGIDSLFYQKLEPFIQISDETVRSESSNQTVAALIELNTADSAALVSMKGIGATLAERILKYRNSLGGFVQKEQLLEIYGIDSARFQLIKPQFSLDTTLVKRININTATEAQLASHPYIRAGLAKEIVSFRKNYRLFLSVNELEKLNLAKNKDLSQLYPYVTIGEN